MNNITYRRVKQNDLQFVRTLFYQVFNRKISTTYYNWAYLDRNYFSFVALVNGKIIGHIGFIKKDIFYNEKFYKSFLRHSSFVLKKYRRKKIYTNLCKYAFKKIINQNQNNIIITFPNSTNIKVSNNSEQYSIFYLKNNNKSILIFKKYHNKIIIMDYFGEVKNFIKNIFNLYIFLDLSFTIEFWGNNKLFNKINKFSYSSITEDQNIGILSNKKITNFNLKKILKNKFLSFGDTDVYNKIN